MNYYFTAVPSTVFYINVTSNSLCRFERRFQKGNVKICEERFFGFVKEVSQKVSFDAVYFSFLFILGNSNFSDQRWKFEFGHFFQIICMLKIAL